MIQQDAIITSPYKYKMDERRTMDRTYYTTQTFHKKPQLEPEEQLPYPIIIQVESLNDSYNKGSNRDEQPMGSRSMIYFPRNPTASNQCFCPECFEPSNKDSLAERRRISNDEREIENEIKRELLRRRRSDDISIRSPTLLNSWQSSISSPPSALKPRMAKKIHAAKSTVTSVTEYGDVIDGEKNRNPSTNKTYKCHVCERAFTWFGNFQKHVLTHGDQSQEHPYFTGGDIPEDKIIIRDDDSTFRCGICNKTFTRMSGLRTHIRMHNGQRPFKCDDCELAFTTNRALKMHTRIHSGERPYKCNQCTKTFTRKDELQAHIYLHKGEKPYKCEKCPAAFVRHGHLQRHMLTHASEKPYKCKSCPKSFTQYRNLQTHVYKHTGERPYVCKFCGKGFTQHGTVQAHERTHTGNKPYACKQCDKRFITSSHLRWHVKKHHTQEQGVDMITDNDVSRTIDDDDCVTI